MEATQPARELTEAEYLEIERLAEVKSEFYAGEMFAMSGGTRWHSIISVNLIREISTRLKGHRCMPFDSNLRLKVETTGLHTYPDLTVVCDEPQFVDDEMDTLQNPTLVFEILSDSTEAYDRGKKFENYRQIASLQEYVLINQREPRIEQFIRQKNAEWIMREAAGLDATLQLPTIGISLSLAELFANVQFPPATIRPSAQVHRQK